jgi:hypothetical protein
MKIEITKSQLEAIKSMADDLSSMAGGKDSGETWKKYVKSVDDMLKKNNLPKRDFN